MCTQHQRDDKALALIGDREGAREAEAAEAISLSGIPDAVPQVLTTAFCYLAYSPYGRGPFCTHRLISAISFFAVGSLSTRLH